MRAFLQISLFLLCLSSAFVLSSCQKDNDSALSDTPNISFKSATVERIADTFGNTNFVLKLTISYTDANGDIGFTGGDSLPPFNSTSPYYYDMIAHYMEKINGSFT
jgi:hypothetical protein